MKPASASGFCLSISCMVRCFGNMHYWTTSLACGNAAAIPLQHCASDTRQISQSGDVRCLSFLPVTIQEVVRELRNGQEQTANLSG